MKKIIEQHLEQNTILRFGDIEYEVKPAGKGLADVWAYGPDFSFPVTIAATKDEVVRTLVRDIEAQILTLFKREIPYVH